MKQFKSFRFNNKHLKYSVGNKDAKYNFNILTVIYLKIEIYRLSDRQNNTERHEKKRNN